MAINNDNNNDQRWSRFIYPSISPPTAAAAATNIDSLNVLEKSSSYNKHQKQLIIIFDNNSSIENLNWKSKLNGKNKTKNQRKKNQPNSTTLTSSIAKCEQKKMIFIELANNNNTNNKCYHSHPSMIID